MSEAQKERDAIVSAADRLLALATAPTPPAIERIVRPANMAELHLAAALSDVTIELHDGFAITQEVQVRGSNVAVTGRTIKGNAGTFFRLPTVMRGFTLRNCTILASEASTIVRIVGNGSRGSGARHVWIRDNVVMSCGSTLVSEGGGGSHISLSGNQYPSGAKIGQRAAWLEGEHVHVTGDQFLCTAPNQQAYRLNNNIRHWSFTRNHVVEDSAKQSAAFQWCEAGIVAYNKFVGGRVDFGPLGSTDAIDPVLGGWKERNAVCRDVIVVENEWPSCRIDLGSHDLYFVRNSSAPVLHTGAGGAGSPARTRSRIFVDGARLA
jgi:hypothetical protein